MEKNAVFFRYSNRSHAAAIFPVETVTTFLGKKGVLFSYIII